MQFVPIPRVQTQTQITLVKAKPKARRLMLEPPPKAPEEDTNRIEEITFDSYASEVWTSDAWWSEVTLDGWESSEVYPSDSWRSGVRSEEVASGGLQ